MKKIILIITSVIMVIALGFATFFGVRAIYDNGVMVGRQEEADENSEKLKALGNAISEKEAFQKELNKLFTDLPSEVNEEDINTYIKKLTELISKVSTEKVKALLEEYLNKWQNFKEVYDSEDNNEIDVNFNQLKVQTEELSNEIKTLFDQTIEDSLESL